MEKQKLNHLPIWILVVFQMILGGLWYGTIVSDTWGRLSGIEPEDYNDFNPVNYVWPLLAAIALSYILAWLLKELKVESTWHALKLVWVLWLGLLFMEIAALNVMSLRPLELTIVDEGATFIKYSVIGFVLTKWKKK